MNISILMWLCLLKLLLTVIRNRYRLKEAKNHIAGEFVTVLSAGNTDFSTWRTNYTGKLLIISYMPKRKEVPLTGPQDMNVEHLNVVDGSKQEK